MKTTTLQISTPQGPSGSVLRGAAIALVLAGGAVGGIAADALDDELEEFSKWEVF